MFFKRTLKRKIQNSMFKTACITLLISLMFILPLMYMTIVPLAAFLSHSVNDSIVQNYLTNFDAEMDMMRKRKDDIDFEAISVEKLIETIRKTDEKNCTVSLVMRQNRVEI